MAAIVRVLRRLMDSLDPPPPSPEPEKPKRRIGFHTDPAEKPVAQGWKPMNLRSVTLEPVQP